jgi:hypothetical protein
MGSDSTEDDNGRGVSSVEGGIGKEEGDAMLVNEHNKDQV